MEDVPMVPGSVADNGQVPQFQQKEFHQRVTQQGEILPAPSTLQIQQEITQIQGQLAHLQGQLAQQQNNTQYQPTQPGSPMPHLVPREPQSKLHFQQVPHSPQFPQMSQSEPQSLHRNVVQQNHQRFLQPPQPQFQSNISQQTQISAGEQAVRRDAMMSYLMNSLNQGIHIGHYGLLVFAMVAHHFMTEAEVMNYLLKDPSMNEEQAKRMYDQVQHRDYNPPRREKILEWQKLQSFPIIPQPDDIDFGNVYKDLHFPDHVYEHINEYYTHPHTNTQ